MARFSGEYEETFTVNAPIDEAKAHFSDLDTIIENYGPVEHAEKVDDMTLRIVLEEKAERGINFQGRYTCKYEFTSDDTLEWKTTSNDNMWSTGRARFRALGDDRTQVDYRQKMETEIKVNRILAKLAGPIVSREIRNGVKQYLARMRRDLENG